MSSRQTLGALLPTPFTDAVFHRHRARSAAAAFNRRNRSFQIPWPAARARFAPWRSSRPPTEHVRAGGLGVVVFAANTGRAPPCAVGQTLLFTDTVPGRRLRLRIAEIEAFKFRGARPARASHRGGPADHPQSTCALADLAWLSLQLMRSALHPTLMAEAPLQRNLARSATAASNCHCYSFRNPCHAALARFAPRRTGRPPIEHARAGRLGVGRLCGQSGARSSPRRWQRILFTDTAPERRLRL